MHLKDGICPKVKTLKIFLIALVLIISTFFVPIIHSFESNPRNEQKDTNPDFFNNEDVTIRTVRKNIKIEESKVEKNGIFIKKIRLSSPDNYSNVQISTNIPEIRYRCQFNLKQLVEESELTIKEFELLDTDKNHLFDKVQWTTPIFSKEKYCINIDMNKIRYTGYSSDIIKNKDGTITKIINPEIKNYYDKQIKSYQPIDTKIEEGMDNNFQNIKNNFKTYFSREINEDFLTYKIGNYNMSYSLNNQGYSVYNSSSQAEVKNNTLIYNNIYDNVDLKYTITSTILLEEYIVKNEETGKKIAEHNGSIFSKNFQINNIIFENNTDGSITFKQKNTGKTLWEIPPPVMYELNNQKQKCYGIYYEIEKEDENNYLISKVLTDEGKDWLRNKERIYPLVIDDTHTYLCDNTDANGYEGVDANGNFNDNEVEFSEGDYNAINGDDENYVIDSASLAEYDDKYQYHRFNFTSIDEQVEDITQIDLTWKGFGGCNNSETLYGYSLWVKENDTYIKASQGTNNSKDNLTARYTSNFSDIIHNGDVLCAAQSDYAVNSSESITSKLSSYYIELKITYTTNADPTVDFKTPINGSTNIDPCPSVTCEAYVNDSDGDSLTVTWSTNTSGSWTNVHTSSESANSTVSYNFTQFNSYNTTYYWRVYADDGTDNVSETYHFTTKPISTCVNSISPYTQTSSPLEITASGDSCLDNVTLWYRYSSDNSSWDTAPAVDTGWLYPTSYGDPENEWDEVGDPGVAFSDDGNYIRGINNSTGDYDTEDYLNFALSNTFLYDKIPPDSTINGITVEVEGYDNSSSTSDLAVSLSKDSGNSYTSTKSNNFDDSGADDVETYGSSSDLWGEASWSKSDFSNNNFRVKCNVTNGDMYVDYIRIKVNYTSSWKEWNGTNPDTDYSSGGWNWTFDFENLNSTGYYEFFSIGKESGHADESHPISSDTKCYFNTSNQQTTEFKPIINSYDLLNKTGSKLNNETGLLDNNKEYYFEINITDNDGWEDIEYINITSWYDNGDDNSDYNDTKGGNLNMFLQYRNISGTKEFDLIWPNEEVELVINNCSETIINSTTRIIKIYFTPKEQVRWGPGDGNWDLTKNATNDPNTWNFNISVEDSSNKKCSKKDEYGISRYTYIMEESKFLYVNVLPGYTAETNIVSFEYSTNYDYKLSIYFEKNLTNASFDSEISIKDSVYILEKADSNDDIFEDKKFNGTGEKYKIEVLNDSGIFQTENNSQTVQIQFKVGVPIGTYSGKYTSRMATKVTQKTN